VLFSQNRWTTTNFSPVSNPPSPKTNEVRQSR
jgi:hypothetical protein